MRANMTLSNRHTVVWMRRFIVGICLVCGLIGMISWGMINSTRNALHSLASDTKPSVVAALKIQAAGSWMNSAALSSYFSTGQATFATSADSIQAQSNLQRALLDASMNVTFGEHETTPILEIQLALSMFNKASGEIKNVDKTILKTRILSASQILNDRLIPAAHELETVNRNELEKEYSAFGTNDTMKTLGLVALSGFLVFSLFIIQRNMRMRTGRTLNPLLAIAWVGAIIIMFDVPYTLLKTDSQIHTAKEIQFGNLDKSLGMFTLANHLRQEGLTYFIAPEQNSDVEFSKDLKSMSDIYKAFIASNDSREADRILRNVKNVYGNLEEYNGLFIRAKSMTDIKTAIQTLDGDHVIISQENGKKVEYRQGALLMYEIDTTLNSITNEADRNFTALTDKTDKQLKSLSLLVLFGPFTVALLSSLGIWLRIKEYE
jgi:uncharacterized protein Veg